MGLQSVDAYVAEVESTIERFAKVYEDIEGKKKHLVSVTGFEPPHWSKEAPPHLKEPVIGMILQLFALARGDPHKVSVSIIEKKPFVKLAYLGVTEDGIEGQTHALEAYIEAVDDACKEKLPEILKEVKELAEKVDSLGDDSKDELEALPTVNQITTAGKLTKLMSQVPQVPPFMKQSLADLEGELREIMDLQKELGSKEAVTKLAADGKRCSDASKFKPKECYQFVYGGSPPSKEHQTS